MSGDEVDIDTRTTDSRRDSNYTDDRRAVDSNEFGSMRSGCWNGFTFLNEKSSGEGVTKNWNFLS